MHHPRKPRAGRLPSLALFALAGVLLPRAASAADDKNGGMPSFAEPEQDNGTERDAAPDTRTGHVYLIPSFGLAAPDGLVGAQHPGDPGRRAGVHVRGHLRGGRGPLREHPDLRRPEHLHRAPHLQPERLRGERVLVRRGGHLPPRAGHRGRPVGQLRDGVPLLQLHRQPAQQGRGQRDDLLPQPAHAPGLPGLRRRPHRLRRATSTRCRGSASAPSSRSTRAPTWRGPSPLVALPPNTLDGPRAYAFFQVGVRIAFDPMRRASPRLQTGALPTSAPGM